MTTKRNLVYELRTAAIECPGPAKYGDLFEDAARRLAVLEEEVEAVREGNKNHIRNAKRGTGVLKAWQQRVARARAATDKERANG